MKFYVELTIGNLLENCCSDFFSPFHEQEAEYFHCCANAFLSACISV
jgi:hypothetical protein